MSDSDKDLIQQTMAPQAMASAVQATLLEGRRLSSAKTVASNAQTVLLVDDNSRYHRMALSVFTDAGYGVVTAADGFEAVAKVVEHKPSVVFTDALLPRLDGYQTCALVKNNSDFRDIPVVMFSSSSHPLNETRATMVGSTSCLTKPLTEHALLEAVKQHTQHEPDNKTATD